MGERCQQCSLAAETTNHILPQTTGQHNQQGQESDPSPPFCHCKTASGALHPVWGSPVQEGCLHTALSPMDGCQDGQGRSHTRKDGRGVSSFEKSRQKVGLTAFNSQLIRVHTEDAARLFLRAAQSQDKMQQTSWNRENCNQIAGLFFYLLT